MTPTDDKTLVADAILRRKFRDGAIVETLKTGTRYRLEHVHQTMFGPQATVRRVVPKVKGKAARRAERGARRLAEGSR